MLIALIEQCRFRTCIWYFSHHARLSRIRDRFLLMRSSWTLFSFSDYLASKVWVSTSKIDRRRVKVMNAGFQPGDLVFIAPHERCRFRSRNAVFLAPLNSGGFEPTVWCFSHHVQLPQLQDSSCEFRGFSHYSRFSCTFSRCKLFRPPSLRSEVRRNRSLQPKLTICETKNITVCFQPGAWCLLRRHSEHCRFKTCNSILLALWQLSGLHIASCLLLK